MRIVLLGLALVTLALPIATAPADAQRAPRPWCMQSGRGGAGGGLPVCSFHTLQQCQASVGPADGYCYQNPALAWERLQGKRPAPPR